MWPLSHIYQSKIREIGGGGGRWRAVGGCEGLWGQQPLYSLQIKCFPCRCHCVGDAGLLVYLQLKNVRLTWIISVQEASLFSRLFPVRIQQPSFRHDFSKCMLVAEPASHISACQFERVRPGMDEWVVCKLRHMSRIRLLTATDKMDALESQSTPGSPTVWC